MKRQHLLWIFLVNWTGMPLLTGLVLNMTTGISPGVMLFLFYNGFSWSIALLIFMLETSRRQLFQQQHARQSSRRLAVYGGGACLLAYLFSPLREHGDSMTLTSVVMAGITYGALAGYVYFRIMYRTQHSVR